MFTYHISFNSGSTYTEFYPTENPNITWNKYGEEIFLRPLIEKIKIGSVLNPTVYSTLVADFFDTTKFGTNLLIKIQRYGVDTFAFRCSICDTEVDIEKGVCLLTPDYNDAYQDIIDVYEKKILAKDLTPSVVSLYYWTHPVAGFINVDFDTFTDTGGNVTWTFSGGATKYARLSWSTAINTGDEVKIEFKNVVGTASMRLVNAAFVGTSNTISTANGVATFVTTGNNTAYVELFQLPGGDVSGSFEYTLWGYSGSRQMSKLSVYIDEILSYLSVTNTVKSTLLFGDALPSVCPSSISTYLAAHPTNDYVTEATKIFNDNIIFSTLDYLETTGLDITLKELMQIVWMKFRCRWYIDSDGYMRIEHEKYFRSWSYQVDITAAGYLSYKPEIDAQTYIYDKSDSYSQITLDEGDVITDDFAKTNVIYDVIKTSPKNTTYMPKNIICDAEVYLSTSDDRESFLFAVYETIGSKHVMYLEAGVIDNTVLVQNVYASWAYVLTKYWSYFGEADSATINGSTTLALDHVKEFLGQSNVKFYYDGILNWYQPVTLSKGAAWIRKIVLSLDTGFYTLDVGFDPYNL